MTDISASGISVRLIASITFPNGVTLTQFADDADPFDVPEVVIAEAAMNLNGELVTWSSPKPLLPKMALIPGSEDDINMNILFDANRPANGKKAVKDILTAVVSYPDGATATFDGGKLLSGMPVRSPSSAGRFKSSVYGFAFPNLAYARGAQ